MPTTWWYVPPRSSTSTLPGQVGRVSTAEAVTPRHVYGEQIGALRPGGDSGGSADQCVALGATGHGDNHTLTGFPV